MGFNSGFKGLIVSSHLRVCLPSSFFPSGFPTKALYNPLLSPTRATCPVHLILDFITRTIFGEGYRLLISSLCSFLHSLLHLSSEVQIFSSTSQRRPYHTISTGPKLSAWIFRNKIHFYDEEPLAPLPTRSWNNTPCRLSVTSYSIHSQLPSILKAVPPSSTSGRALPWWQGPTYHGPLSLHLP